MRCLFAFAGIALLISWCGWAAEEDAVVGVWTVQDGDGRIQISKVQDGTFEGKLVWVVEPNYEKGDPEEGKPRHDRKNPDPAKRNQPLVGLKLMTGFAYAGGKVWKGGTIYDADSGKTYKCKLTLADKDKLEVRGFIGVSLLGRTEHWTRYVEPPK